MGGLRQPRTRRGMPGQYIGGSVDVWADTWADTWADGSADTDEDGMGEPSPDPAPTSHGNDI